MKREKETVTVLIHTDEFRADHAADVCIQHEVSIHDHIEKLLCLAYANHTGTGRYPGITARIEIPSMLIWEYRRLYLGEALEEREG